jgi:hypothetical protein
LVRRAWTVSGEYYEGCLRLPRVHLEVVISLCRTIVVGHRATWSVSPRTGQDNKVTLLCLLNDANDGFRAFYVFPGLQVRHGFRVNSAFLANGKKLRSIGQFYRAVVETDREALQGGHPRRPSVLNGVPQIATLSRAVLRRRSTPNPGGDADVNGIWAAGGEGRETEIDYNKTAKPADRTVVEFVAAKASRILKAQQLSTSSLQQVQHQSLRNRKILPSSSNPKFVAPRHSALTTLAAGERMRRKLRPGAHL